MSAAPLSDEILAQTVSAYQEHGTLQKAAAALGVHHTMVHYRLKVAAQRGLLLDHKATMPGYVIQSVAERLDGKWIKQVQEPTGKRLANHIAAYGRTPGVNDAGKCSRIGRKSLFRRPLARLLATVGTGRDRRLIRNVAGILCRRQLITITRPAGLRVFLIILGGRGDESSRKDQSGQNKIAHESTSCLRSMVSEPSPPPIYSRDRNSPSLRSPKGGGDKEVIR